MIKYIQSMLDLALQGDRQGVWFGGAVYTFLLCGYSILFQLISRSWPSITGQLNHSGLDEFGSAIVLSAQDYRADALYTYQVQGKTFQSERISSWIIVAGHNARFVLKHQLSKVKTYPDNKVKVYYKPSNPAKSWLLLPSKLGIFITAVITVLPAFSYWLEFYS
jgi:hypothetical protein